MKSLRLLLVEDSQSDVRLIREALREIGVPVQVSVAHDGPTALQQLARSEQGSMARPDLIVLDLNLPGMNGREVLAQVKASATLRQIPVVIMTSSRADDDVKECYALNANCYIAKPCDLNEYIEVVRAIEDFWFFTATLPQPSRPSLEFSKVTAAGMTSAGSSAL